MKTYDFGERTLNFAMDVRTFFRKLPDNLINSIDGKQLIKSLGSVGANYLEANDSLGDRDFLFRLKISRKEAKESKYWLRLLKASNSEEALESFTAVQG